MLCVDVGLAWHHHAAGVARSPLEPVLRRWEIGVVIEALTPDAIVLERATRRVLGAWRVGVPVGGSPHSSTARVRRAASGRPRVKRAV